MWAISWVHIGGYPAKRALSVMRKHGGPGPFGRMPSILNILSSYMVISIPRMTRIKFLTLLMLKPQYSRRTFRYHGCWWPGSLHQQPWINTGSLIVLCDKHDLVFHSDGSKLQCHLCILTHLPWTKWPPLWQTALSNAFSWMKIIQLCF